MQNEKSKFEIKVLEAVREIPKGEVLTYKAVAKLAGKPKAWRAVGNVLNKNKDKKIPCHRVIRSNGNIGGYKDGIKKKINLLKNEGILINSHGRIRIPRAIRRGLRYSHAKITSRFNK